MVRKRAFRLKAAFVLCAVVAVGLCAGRLVHKRLYDGDTLEIVTIHGSMTTRDPLIIELINSPAMQRLKKIRQYGSNDYGLQHMHDYSRYDHSLGVFYLLYVHGADRTQQVAGLLHDVSHTVFSHACDPLFMADKSIAVAYQDTIHGSFLKEHGLGTILEKYGLSVAQVLPDNHQFRALEQPAPALCADRIEYNIHAAYRDNLLSPTTICTIRDDLHFDGHDWYFDHAAVAKQFAYIALHQTVYMWGNPGSVLVNKWTSDALQRAVACGLITLHDICFNLTDDEMWALLKGAQDPEIQTCVERICHAYTRFSWAERDQDGAVQLKAKCWAVDPLIKVVDRLVPLSQLDPAFKRDYAQILHMTRQGWTVTVQEKAVSDLTMPDPRLTCAGIVPLEQRNSAYCAS